MKNVGAFFLRHKRNFWEHFRRTPESLSSIQWFLLSRALQTKSNRCTSGINNKNLLPLLVKRGQLRTNSVSGYLPTRKLVAVRVSAAWPFSLIRVVVFPFSQLFWQFPLVQVTLQMLGVKTTLMRPVWFPTVSGGKEKKKNKQITLVSIDFLQKVFGKKKGEGMEGDRSTGGGQSAVFSLIDLQWCLWNRSRKLSKQNSGICSKTTFKVKSLEWD